jgi:hypothetical protein
VASAPPRKPNSSNATRSARSDAGATVAAVERGGDAGYKARGAHLTVVAAVAAPPLVAHLEGSLRLPEGERVHGGEHVAPTPREHRCACGLRSRDPGGRTGCGRACLACRAHRRHRRGRCWIRSSSPQSPCDRLENWTVSPHLLYWLYTGRTRSER